LPKKGYVSTGDSSLPEEYMKAIKMLLEDPKYVAEMRAKGHARISKSLVIRMSLIHYLKDRGIDIAQISEAANK